MSSRYGCSRYRCLAVLCAGLLYSLPAAADVVQDLLDEWRTELRAAGDKTAFSAVAGRTAWYRDIAGRSCPSCHTDSPHKSGRHARTGKVIEPMAPSTNPQRLTDRQHINKWLKRNCKWTFGRECTAQEKGDILTWLSQQ